MKRANPIYNPQSQVQNSDGSYTRTVFPGNVVPQSMFSPASAKALAVFQSSGNLTPNTGAAPGTAAYVTNNYLESSGTQIYPVNKESIKIDHIFSEKHRISGCFGDDHEHETAGHTLPARKCTQPSRDREGAVECRHLIRLDATWGRVQLAKLVGAILGVASRIPREPRTELFGEIFRAFRPLYP